MSVLIKGMEMKRPIDADAAIDHFRRIIDATNTDSEYNTGFVDGLEFCISHLSTMPSVQPEPKTAYWRTHIFDGIMGGRPRAYMCNYCNFISFAQTDYCPNCGAKMEGEE